MLTALATTHVATTQGLSRTRCDWLAVLDTLAQDSALLHHRAMVAGRLLKGDLMEHVTLDDALGDTRADLLREVAVHVARLAVMVEGGR